MFLAPFVLSGCSNDALLYFNSQPITKETVNYPSRNFAVGQKIHYVLILPKGFKNEYIRVQIVKKEDKTNHWGYKIYQSRDFHVDTTKNYFIITLCSEKRGIILCRFLVLIILIFRLQETIFG